MRKVLLAAAALIVLFVGAGLLAAANLNAWLNENREWLGTEAQQVVGRRVSFGELEVSIWSGLGVRVTDVSIGDDPAYSKDNFVTAGVVDVRVAILPALMGEIQVGRVILREPSIRVIQGDNGLSIDSLGGARETDAKTSGKGTPEKDASESGASQAIALTVSLIDVQGGRFVFVDRTTQPATELTLTRLDFSASDVSLTDPIRFDLRAAALGADAQNIAVSGTVGPITASEDEFALDVALSVGPLSIDDAIGQPAVKLALPADLVAGGTLKVEVHAKGELAALTLDGELDATDAAFALGASGDTGEEAGFRKRKGETLRFAWSAVRQGAALNVSKADLEMGDTRIHLEATVEGVPSAPRGTFEAGSDLIRLADFGVTATEGMPADEITKLTIDGRFAMPADGPRLTVMLGSPAGVVSGAAYENLKFDFEFAGGRATIKSLTMTTFGGSVEVSGNYDLGDGRPSFDLDTRVANISVPGLVASQNRSMASMVEGTMAGNLAVRGSGSEWEEIRERMVGKGNLIMEDGTLKDVNLAEGVIKGITGVAGLSNLINASVREKYPSVFGAGDTVFEKLDAKLDIRSGVATIRDFRLAARDYSLDGEGTYALRNELDMRVAMTLSKPFSADLIDSVKEARYLQNAGGQIEIPVRLRGGLPNVRPEPDVSRVARIVQAELVGDLLDKALGGKSSDGTEKEDAGQELLRRGLEIFGGGRK